MAKASIQLATQPPVVVEIIPTGTVVPLPETQAPGKDFVGPLAQLATNTQAIPDAARRQALADVTAAEAEIQGVENASGPRYAKIVRAVMVCLDMGFIRKEISGAVMAASHPSEHPITVTKFSDGTTRTETGEPGRVARYVKLAKWSQGLYGDTETRPEGGVMIMGETYVTPLQALESAKHNMTAVYQAWRNATSAPIDMSGLYSQIDAAAESASQTFAVRVKTTVEGEEKPKRLLVIEDAKATWGALRGIMKYGKASEKLSFQKRKWLAETLLGLIVEGDKSENEESA